MSVPKLRRQTFETAIIERYRRRESSVEEALIEMYPGRVLSRPGADRDRKCAKRVDEAELLLPLTCG